MTTDVQALVVDDEPDICELLAMTLNRMDIATETAGDVASAKKKLRGGDFDLCLTDMRLPDGDGLELVEWMQSHTPGVPVAMITAHGSVETAVQALKLGAFDFVSKPLDVKDLRNIVGAAIRLGAAGGDAGRELLGRSAAIDRVRDMIARVSRSQAPVHICGESGTGKELVARMIHESGPRKEGPFVPVNCGAIPAELMESEFFGHKKGSFTGAVTDKKGLIETADGGTLFLDEIADLPLAMQVKLLRFIQEKTIRPVGAPREVAVDVRILSATHRDLAAMVAGGEFREDLFYRINVIELRVPPLRERTEDIPLLAEAILARFARESGGEPAEMTPGALEALCSYGFPGNVRELENILERAVTLSPNGIIDSGDLQLRPVVATSKGEVSPTAAAARAEALGDQLEDVERQAIVDALEKTRYNKTAAAKLLGLTFRQLRYRIKKLNID
ncbi:sigma-54-dependent transcriptional regulator [Lentisalinibacter salinarum]|uniref:sigma-54-dependent transcriptional regulator n=1 Tax=Lentisalinibacter salinarum TaxID=2992239 RepID=UPI00386AB6D6